MDTTVPKVLYISVLLCGKVILLSVNAHAPSLFIPCTYHIVSVNFVYHCRAIQEGATHHQVLHMGSAVVPMGLPTHLHTEVRPVHQEVLMVVMEPQVMEDNMGLDQGVPPVGLMGLMGDSLMEDLTDTMLLQVTVG